MASLPYLVLSPTSLLSLVGFFYGKDKTIPTPQEDYRHATVDLVIPAHNEAKNIVLCLASIAQQTITPNQIYLIDDGSTDKTSEYAAEFAKLAALNVVILRRDIPEGKTPSLYYAAKHSQADVLFVLDADTHLRSNHYIEKLVFELYQGVGIACACGIIEPEFEKHRQAIQKTPAVLQFSERFPDVAYPKHTRFIDKIEQSITNNYRAELYHFLQNFIYNGEMVYFGTIINPVGCAVAYRRKYLLDIIDKYKIKHGFNLTCSEDIFIGFAFANEGYRNIQVMDVFANTGEPKISRLPKQIMLWSSSFLQSCFYFDNLAKTPFKLPALILNKIKHKNDIKQKQAIEKRKIQEAYRQSFGQELTKQYGRPIGWFIFTSLFEKISFPIILLIFILLKWWTILAISMAAEIIIYTLVIMIMSPRKRIQNGLKSLCYAPIRYFFLMYDLVVIANFIKDIWITRNRQWRK